MNSPYTKHLDTPLEAHHASSVPMMPTYAPAPAAPMVVHAPADSGGAKATMALVALVLAAIASVGGYMIGKGIGPSWGELRRFEALAGREGEIRGRDAGWSVGRKQGHTEMSYLAKYEKLRTQATAFNQGWRSGINTGRMMGNARWNARYGGYGNAYGGYGYGRGYNPWYRRNSYGYGGYYGSRTSNALASAQRLANATGQEVVVDIY